MVDRIPFVKLIDWLRFDWFMIDWLLSRLMRICGWWPAFVLTNDGLQTELDVALMRICGWWPAFVLTNDGLQTELDVAFALSQNVNAPFALVHTIIFDVTLNSSLHSAPTQRWTRIVSFVWRSVARFNLIVFAVFKYMISLWNSRRQIIAVWKPAQKLPINQRQHQTIDDSIHD